MTLLFTLALPVYADSLVDVVAAVQKSVVGVGAAYPKRAPTGGNSPRRLFGSGFAVTHNRQNLIVTNYHVVDQRLDDQRGEHLAVFSGSGSKAVQHEATLLASDESHDLAVMHYNNGALPPMALAAADLVRVGERVAFTGFPIGAVLGLYPATHEGIVAAVAPIARPVDKGRELSAVQMRRLREPYWIYQLDAIAYPGNSGSAVYLQSSGQVIGVMNSVYVKESRESLLERPSGISYAIPITHLLRLLESIPD
ncbi:MAG: serine protease [Pseudomonadota bacterium]